MCSEAELHVVKLRGRNLALQVPDDGGVLVGRDVGVHRARALLRGDRHRAGALHVRVGVTVALMKQFLVTRVMIVNYVVARSTHAFADKNCVFLRIDGRIR